MTPRKTVLITGASGGIGYELALLFAQGGYDLVLVARSRQKLAELATRLQHDYAATSTVMAIDLLDPAAPKAIVACLREAGVRVEVLVNNAGFGTYGPFAQSDLDDELAMIQLNVAAVTALTRLLLPEMLARRDGRILNIASTAAFQPGPLMSVYYGTKAFVLFLSEALSNELKGTGVTVTALCPGPTRTGFQERAGMGPLRLFGLGVMDAATVARAGYHGLLRGDPVVIPGIVNRLITLLVRVAPRWMVRAIVRRLQERRAHSG